MLFFFFFKQKTAYDMRISDWSSDVCSSDLDAGSADDYHKLVDALGGLSERITVCYLATAPHLFASICTHLAGVGLNHANVRVVLEKPLGHDLASSDAINAEVGHHFPANQIYRIDHYLGKESVQNLMAIRFGDRKSGVSGKSGSERVDLGGR